MKKYKEFYESPQTKWTSVVLESGFCAASADVKNDSSENGRIEAHKINDGFGFSFDDQNWDDVQQTSF